MELFALVALVGLLALATLLGIWWRSRQGKVRHDTDSLIDSRYLDPTAAITLIQFGSEYCAYCPQQWRLITDEVAAAPDLAMRSLDISVDSQLAEKLGISQTPTTLLVSSGGELLSRIGGLAKRDILQREIAYARQKRRDKNDEYLI